MTKPAESKPARSRARVESTAQRLRRVATSALVAEVPGRLAAHARETDRVVAAVPGPVSAYDETLGPYRTMVGVLADLPHVYETAERQIRGSVIAFTRTKPEPSAPPTPGPGHVQIAQHAEFPLLVAELHRRLAAMYAPLPEVLEARPGLADLLGPDLDRYRVMLDTLSHAAECVRNVTRITDALRVLGAVTPADFAALAAVMPQADPSDASGSTESADPGEADSATDGAEGGDRSGDPPESAAAPGAPNPFSALSRSRP